MGRVTKLVTSIATVGIATAAFAGVASAHELSKKQYLKQGNGVCKTTNNDLGAVFEEAFAGLGQNDQPSPEQIATAVSGAVPIFRQGLDDLEALEGPSALDKKVDKLVDQYRDAIDAVEADPASAFDEDGPEVFRKPDKQAKKLGLKECAQNA